jgi:hypothetical protein
MSHKIEFFKEISNVLKCYMFSFEAEGFFCSLDVLYGGLGIGKLQFLIKKLFDFFPVVNFFHFLAIKTLDPDRYSAFNAGC